MTTPCKNKVSPFETRQEIEQSAPDAVINPDELPMLLLHFICWAELGEKHGTLATRFRELGTAPIKLANDLNQKARHVIRRQGVSCTDGLIQRFSIIGGLNFILMPKFYKSLILACRPLRQPARGRKHPPQTSKVTEVLQQNKWWNDI